MKRKSEEAGIRKEIEAESARERLLRLIRRIPTSETTGSVVKTLERAYDSALRHKETGAEKMNDAYYAFGLRLIEVLHRIGYFGEKGKPLDYDDAKSFTLRNSATNIGFDKGLTLAAYILSELKDAEQREAVKKSLGQLANDIRDIAKNVPPGGWDVVKKAVASRLPTYALALWLVCKEPEQSPTDNSVSRM